MANATSIEINFGKALSQEVKPFKLYLREIIGNKIVTIDSTSIVKGKARFGDKTYFSGFYELYLEESNRIEFLINKQAKISVSCQALPIQDAVVFEDAENKALWSYKYFSRRINGEISAFRKAKEVSHLALFDAKIDSMNKIKDQFQYSFLKKNKGMLIRDFVAASSQDLLNSLGMNYRKEHFFDNVNFTNPALIRSSVLPSIIMEYLQVHTNHDEVGFRESIDVILDKALVNSEIHQFCMMTLMDLFNKVGPSIVFQYIVENHLLINGCADNVDNTDLSTLASEYAKLMPGNVVPNLNFLDTKGNAHKLLDLATGFKSTIIFFWSSHCSYCHAAIPELKRFINAENSNVHLITFSLDEQKLSWENGIYDTKLIGSHYSDLKGWNSEVVQKLKVHKTPSFYIINEDGLILSKPVDVKELFSFYKLEPKVSNQ